MPNITDWLMVAITAIYVVATILICFFNYSSAKATREQTAEAKRQYEENNRAFVTVTFEVIRNGLATLRIHNHGNKIARRVSIKVDESFVENITDEFSRNAINRLNKSSFVLGIGQSFYASIGASKELENLGKKPLLIHITYDDALASYSENTSIDLTQYYWALMYESSVEDARQELKYISKNLKSIDKTLRTERNQGTPTDM